MGWIQIQRHFLRKKVVLGKGDIHFHLFKRSLLHNSGTLTPPHGYGASLSRKLHMNTHTHTDKRAAPVKTSGCYLPAAKHHLCKQCLVHQEDKIHKVK